MAEAVRLVIWDLDETFWKGTLTEGGIREYVKEHHDIVIELARRGIISSICSKNDDAPVRKVLAEYGILDYFVFPSISWEPKGPRLAQLIEDVQLRAPTVMFIDDNPGNRAEAASMVPGLQVEDETFVARMLEDPRFRGKDDSSLSRLAQYRLLETRKRDERQAASGGGNEAFLRSCDVRVYIEYDIAAHLDRAIELINRTNQLNYTKKRLPDDMDSARAMLLEQLKGFNRQAGLVRVVDNYGDYGFVGFFMTVNGRYDGSTGDAYRRLQHYCFSCRTLGMFVEQWLYDYLGRPALDVVGDVLTDLSKPRRIDWIRLVASMSEGGVQHPPVAPEIRLYGGCEANAVSVYLTPYCDRMRMIGNFRAGGLFVRVNSAAIALSSFDRTPAAFAQEAEILGLPLDAMAGDYMADAEPGTVFIFNCGLDARGSRFRHRVHGWEINAAPRGISGLHFPVATEQRVIAALDAKGNFDAASRTQILRAARHIRENYELIRGMNKGERFHIMRALIRRVPKHCKLVIVLNHIEWRDDAGRIRHSPAAERYAAQMRQLALKFPFVGVVSFSEVIDSPDQILGKDNHYERMVYLRLAERLVELIPQLPGRGQHAQFEDDEREAA